MNSPFLSHYSKGSVLMMCNHHGKDKENIKCSAGWNKGFQNLFRISVDSFTGEESDINNKDSSLK